MINIQFAKYYSQLFNQILFIIIYALLFTIGCTKPDSENLPDIPEPGNENDRPKSIKITYYTLNNEFLRKYTYFPDWSSPTDSFILERHDSIDFKVNNIIYIRKNKQILYRDNKSKLISGYSFHPYINKVNFYLNGILEETSVIPVWDHNDYQMSSRFYSIGQNFYYNVLHFSYSLNPLEPEKKYVDSIRYDITKINPDTVLSSIIDLNDKHNWITKIGNSIYTEQDVDQSSRYWNYFSYESPFKQYLFPDSYKSFYHLKSQYVCDSFNLHLGRFENLYLNGNVIKKYHPEFERKITYSYNSDTNSLKKIIDVINPIVSDPMWYYIGHEIVKYGGQRDAYEVYQWTCSSFIDSAFSYKSGSRQLVEISYSNNTSEKDNLGRIVKLIRKKSNLDYYAVLEVTY